MPIVRVELWLGKTQEVKKKVAKAITEVMVENIGCPAQAVIVLFDEVSQENWAIGGELCSDMFTGEKLNADLHKK